MVSDYLYPMHLFKITIISLGLPESILTRTRLELVEVFDILHPDYYHLNY